MFSLIDYATGVVMGASLMSLAPSIGRKIKALWVKETSKAKTAVVTEAKAIHTSLSTEAADIAKKI